MQILFSGRHKCLVSEVSTYLEKEALRDSCNEEAWHNTADCTGIAQLIKGEYQGNRTHDSILKYILQRGCHKDR